MKRALEKDLLYEDKGHTPVFFHCIFVKDSLVTWKTNYTQAQCRKSEGKNVIKDRRYRLYPGNRKVLIVL